MLRFEWLVLSIYNLMAVSYRLHGKCNFMLLQNHIYLQLFQKSGMFSFFYIHEIIFILSPKNFFRLLYRKIFPRSLKYVMFIFYKYPIY
mgnify:FL=1